MIKKRIAIPKGFLFASVEAAVKKPGRKDLALICSTGEASVSGMFTQNRVKAAPVRLGMQRIASGKGRAVVVNSGNANACTGRQGMEDAREMASLIAEGLGVDESLVYVCSTGVIGTPLPMEKIRKAVPGLIRELGKAGIEDVAAAMMTTDSFPKIASKRLMIGGRAVTITGVCKGAGMIRPDMATMLSFIITDALMDVEALDAALRESVSLSFNRITVDGDMSTNDTVLAMANGMAGNGPIRKHGRTYRVFLDALSAVATELSRMIVRDGEGATKLIRVHIKNAKTKRDAERAAFAVAHSLLVKTAVYGNDANWGRIMAALGYSGIAMREAKTDIYFGMVKVVKGGIATGRDPEATKELRQSEVTITADLNLGAFSAEVLTCDLTEEYIRINAEYRT